MSDDLLYPYIEIETRDDGPMCTRVADSNHRRPGHSYLTITSTLDHVFQELNRMFAHDAHLHAYMPHLGVIQIGIRSLHASAEPIAEGNPVEIYHQIAPHLYMMSTK